MDWSIPILGLVTFVASVGGTITGFGISTIMMPVLSMFLPFSSVLLFVGVIHLFGDVWKMVFFKRGIRWSLILGFGIPGIAASYLGAAISLNMEPSLMKRLLGAFLLAYALFLFFFKTWQIPSTKLSSVAGGSLSGLFAGIFGVGGAVRAAFLTAYNLPKDAYIFTSGAIAFLIDITRITTYVSGGTRIGPDRLYVLALCIAISLAGAYWAKRIVNKVPQKEFRFVVVGFLALIAVKFLASP